MKGARDEVRKMSNGSFHDGESPEEYVKAAARAGFKITPEHAADVAENIATFRRASESLREIDTSQFEPAGVFRPRRPG